MLDFLKLIHLMWVCKEVSWKYALKDSGKGTMIYAHCRIFRKEINTERDRLNEITC